MVTYDILVNLKGHNNRVRAVVWTDNDAEVISCGADGAVYQWNVATSRRVSENVIKQCQYNGVAVSKDMRSIVAVGSESIKELADSQVYMSCVQPAYSVRPRTATKTTFNAKT